MKRSLKFQRGFLAGILPALGSFFGSSAGAGVLGSIGGALIGGIGQERTNDANIELSRENREFNAEQADIARQFNASQAEINRQFQSNEVDEQREWGLAQANSSYQRAVGDLRAAGLNPMLAYSQGGAPMPQGGAASGSLASGTSASSVQSAMLQSTAQAALSGAGQAAQVNNLVKQGDNIDADTNLKKAQAQFQETSAGNMKQQTDVKLPAEVEKIQKEIQLIWKQGLNATEQGNLMRIQVELIDIQKRVEAGKLDVMDADIALKEVQLILDKLAVPEAEASAKFYKDELGQMSPFLRQILEILRAVGGFRPRGR